MDPVRLVAANLYRPQPTLPGVVLEKISRPPRDYRPERAVPIEAGLVKVAKDARRRRTEAIAGAVVRPCVFVLSHYQKRATSDVIVDKFARAAEYTNVQ